MLQEHHQEGKTFSEIVSWFSFRITTLTLIKYILHIIDINMTLWQNSKMTSRALSVELNPYRCTGEVKNESFTRTTSHTILEHYIWHLFVFVFIYLNVINKCSFTIQLSFCMVTESVHLLCNSKFWSEWVKTRTLTFFQNGYFKMWELFE